MLRALAASLALFAASCARPPPPPAPPPRPSMESLRESLRQAEIDFAKASLSRGIEAWLDAFGDDGMLLSAKADVVRGKEALRKTMGPLLAKTKVNWRPTVVEVAPSGEMGFTYGPYEVITRHPGGKETVVARGSFMTVWKRDASGTWKVVGDLGSEDPSSPGGG